MARYEIKYLDDYSETIAAAEVDYGSEAQDYTFSDGDRLIALIPVANVRSVVRLGGEQVTD